MLYECPEGHTSSVTRFPNGQGVRRCFFCPAVAVETYDPRVLMRAINNAGYFLSPNQGEQPDPLRANYWLRSAFPSDHPSYVNPGTLDGPF